MDSELDLATASREALLVVIAELKATITQSQQRVAALEGRLNWRYFGTAHGSYVVFETDTGLVLLNWRGARSRILYEEILAVADGRAPGRQKLLFPIPLELDALGSAALQENLEFFRGNGFDIEPFGRNYYRIEALPEWLHPGQGESFARDLLGWLRERGLNPDRPQPAREEIARLASSRMAGSGHSS